MPKAMSRTSGGSSAVGKAIASGFMPTILSSPPQGAIVGSALVPASPTMPWGRARIAQWSMAPQWLLRPTAANATPCPAAASTARSMANATATWPMALPPSTTIAPPTRLATLGRPRGSTPPPVSFFTYSGTRRTPWLWMPRRSAATSEPTRRPASASPMPQAAKMRATSAVSRPGGTRASPSVPGYWAMLASRGRPLAAGPTVRQVSSRGGIASKTAANAMEPSGPGPRSPHPPYHGCQVVPGEGEQRPHPRLGRLRVAQADRFQHVAVHVEGGLVGLREPGREPHRGAERGAHRADELAEDEVVGGAQDLGVEVEVGGAAGVEVGRQAPRHGEAGGLDPGQVGRGGALGGERRGRGLDDPASLDQRRDELGVGVAALGLPGQEVGVEQVPGVALADRHPEPRTRLDQPLGGEEADRLPQRGPADPEAAAQLGLVRQPLARRPVTLQDRERQAADDLAVDARAGERRRHASPARRICCSWTMTARISSVPLASSW